MATTPKSAGLSRRAKRTVATIWMTCITTCENTVTPAPRTARRRNARSSFSVGRNVPFASNGFK